MNIPILPIKIDKLYFYNGEMSGMYWFEEIQLFIDCGGVIISIDYAIIFEGYDNVLSNFVDTLENFKCEDVLSKQVGKLLINSFYGRLGMDREASKSIIGYNDDYEEYMRYVDDIVIYKKKFVRDTIRNVAVAAAITSKARIKLYKGYLSVQTHGGRLLYSDTDSIVAGFTDINHIIDKDIGGIIFDSTKEDTKIDKAVFISSKTYSLVLGSGKTITKIKGIKTNNLGFDELQASFYNNRRLEFDEQIVFSKKNYTIDIKTIKKTIDTNSYSKRTFSSDKLYTVPKTY